MFVINSVFLLYPAAPISVLALATTLSFHDVVAACVPSIYELEITPTDTPTIKAFFNNLFISHSPYM